MLPRVTGWIEKRDLTIRFSIYLSRRFSDVLQNSTHSYPATRRRIYSHFTVLPELVTEGDSLDEALDNVKDALVAVIEIYQDLGRSLHTTVKCII